MKKTVLVFSILTLVCSAASIPALAGTVYSSGTTTFGSPLSPNISDPYGTTVNVVSDEFTLTQSGTITGITFGYVDYASDTLQSVEWSLGTSPYGSEDGTGVADTSLAGEGTNLVGYGVGYASFATSSITLGAGTYYLTLQDATTAEDAPVYWDENDGTSTGYQTFAGTSLGSIGGETFSLTGPDTSPVPEPSSFLLLGSGLVGIAGMIRRKLKA